MKNADSGHDVRSCAIEPLEGRTLLNSPLVSVSNAVVRERGSGSVSYALVTVSLERRPSALVKIGYSTKAATATGDVDFVAKPGTLLIPAGSKSGTIRIKIIGDALTEGNEKFYVRLTSAVHATLPSPAPISIVRIADSLPAPGPIATNLSSQTAGQRGAFNNSLLAASFVAPAGGLTLKELTLNIAFFNNGVPLVRVFSSGAAGAASPTTQIAIYERTSAISTQITPTKFANAQGILLVPGTKYWVVLTANNGTINWGYTNTSSGSGSGFTGEWASSVNGGQSWAVSTSFPLQMQVGTT